MSTRIFVSHSSCDVDLVNQFIQALEAFFIFQDKDIRCTSLPGYRLRTGTHTSTTLRKELSSAEIILGLVTPQSVESGWVLFELGAGWGSEKWVIPILIGVDFDSLPGPLRETNAANMSVHSEIKQLFTEIQDHLKLEVRIPARGAKALDSLIKAAKLYETAKAADDLSSARSVKTARPAKTAKTAKTAKASLNPQIAAWPFPTGNKP